jgi:hypothetical protein
MPLQGWWTGAEKALPPLTSPKSMKRKKHGGGNSTPSTSFIRRKAVLKKPFTGILFVCLLLAASGCSTTKNLTKKILPASVAQKIITNEADLKKRVMIFPFVDQAGVGPR